MGLAGKLIVEMPTFDLWAQVQKFTGGIRIEGLFSRHGVDPAAQQVPYIEGRPFPYLNREKPVKQMINGTTRQFDRWRKQCVSNFFGKASKWLKVEMRQVAFLRWNANLLEVLSYSDDSPKRTKSWNSFHERCFQYLPANLTTYQQKHLQATKMLFPHGPWIGWWGR